MLLYGIKHMLMLKNIKKPQENGLLLRQKMQTLQS